jgi:hypothetical protein
MFYRSIDGRVIGACMIEAAAAVDDRSPAAARDLMRSRSARDLHTDSITTAASTHDVDND